jgi:cobalt transporter subunit CbtB
MSYSIQTTKLFNIIPKSALIVLIVTFSIGLFIVGFDQGHIFSVIHGESAFVDQFLHELTHDMRHAAGFPCH